MDKHKKYFRVRPSIESRVTGIRDGVTCQVETRFTKSQPSFIDKTEKAYFQDYCKYLWENRKNDNFPLTDPSRISKITYYKTKKGVKETDFISSLTDNSFNLFDFIVSEETYKLLLEANLPIYNKIQAYIPEFSTQREYFLLGFPELSLENVDYAHSVILDSFSGIQLRFNSYEEYANRTYKFTKMHNIQLKADYKYDIIKLQNTGLFFSNSLIEVMRHHNITGLDYLTQSIILPV